MASLKARAEAAEHRVEALEARLKRDSSNSSKPPSSDPPWKPPAERRQKGRKRGGQPGHGGNHRELVQPDELVVIKPESCRGCGAGLTGHDAEPWRHQVTEIPEVIARTTEYQVHSLTCACGVETRAALPLDVPRSAFGPRLQAMVAVCSGAYRLSKRSIVEMLGDFFGVEISLGSIANIEAATTAALAAPFEEAIEKVRESRILHVDETHWRVDKKMAWTWVAVTLSAVLFFIRPRRDKAAAQEIVGKGFCGVLVADRYNGYHWFNEQRRQFCWAHLLRDFRGLLEYGPVARSFGERLVGLTDRLFHEWHRYRRRVISRPELLANAEPLQAAMHSLLCEGVGSTSQPVATLFAQLLEREQCLWTFLRRPGVSPTNNAAERALRRPVMWRKTSFGSDSERGVRFAERILTVVACLRLHRRRVLEYVTQACHARLVGGSAPPPLFLPAPT